MVKSLHNSRLFAFTSKDLQKELEIFINFQALIQAA